MYFTGSEWPKFDAPVSSDARAPICITDNSDEEFNPHMHMAVFQVQDASKQPGSVVVVLKRIALGVQDFLKSILTT